MRNSALPDWLKLYDQTVQESDPSDLLLRIEVTLTVMHFRCVEMHLQPSCHPIELALLERCASNLRKLKRKTREGIEQEQPPQSSHPDR